jgi:hypothetical protein
VRFRAAPGIFSGFRRLKQNELTPKAARPVDSAADRADATESRCLSIEMRPRPAFGVDVLNAEVDGLL